MGEHADGGTCFVAELEEVFFHLPFEFGLGLGDELDGFWGFSGWVVAVFWGFFFSSTALALGVVFFGGGEAVFQVFLGDVFDPSGAEGLEVFGIAERWQEDVLVELGEVERGGGPFGFLGDLDVVGLGENG